METTWEPPATTGGFARETSPPAKFVVGGHKRREYKPQHDSSRALIATFAVMPPSTQGLA